MQRALTPAAATAARPKLPPIIGPGAKRQAARLKAKAEALIQVYAQTPVDTAPSRQVLRRAARKQAKRAQRDIRYRTSITAAATKARKAVA